MLASKYVSVGIRCSLVVLTASPVNESYSREIKISRADLLGDLKPSEKRLAYLDVGGECWFVLGCNAKGKPIGEPENIPVECGVIIFQVSKSEVFRTAPKRPFTGLPFSVWMALAKALPVKWSEVGEGAQRYLSQR